jgi:hypothetical protein
LIKVFCHYTSENVRMLLFEHNTSQLFHKLPQGEFRGGTPLIFWLASRKTIQIPSRFVKMPSGHFCETTVNNDSFHLT